MILFYDSEEKSYNTYLKKHCMKESIEFIFYDPKVGLFFDNKGNKIDKLRISLFGDLNISNINNPFNIFKYDADLYYEQMEKDTTIYTDNTIMKKKAEEFLSKFNSNLSSVKRNLKTSINAKTINLCGIFSYIKDRPSIAPKDCYLLLFQSIDNKLLYLYSIDNKYYANFIGEEMDMDIPSIGSKINKDIFLAFSFNKIN